MITTKIKTFNRGLILMSIIACAKFSVDTYKYSLWGLFWFAYLIIVCILGITIIDELDKYLESKFVQKNGE